MSKINSTNTLASFIVYCMTHPQLRFWQALRNWSGYHFIVATDTDIVAGARQIDRELLRDTFHWEGRRHDEDAKSVN